MLSVDPKATGWLRRWLGPTLIGILLIGLAAIEMLQSRHHDEPLPLPTVAPSSPAEQTESP